MMHRLNFPDKNEYKTFLKQTVTYSNRTDRRSVRALILQYARRADRLQIKLLRIRSPSTCDSKSAHSSSEARRFFVAK